MVKPDLYLDVDGVMLVVGPCTGHDDYQKENDFLFDWVMAFKSRFNRIFWLTCWTKSRLIREHPKFEKIGAIEAAWGPEKTTGVDWSRPFIWIEDGVLDSEREAFRHLAGPDQQIWELRQAMPPALGQRK